jgi:hypothetical protein
VGSVGVVTHYSRSIVAEKVCTCESISCSILASNLVNLARMDSMLESPPAVESSVSSSERSLALASDKSSVRASDHEVASDGAIESLAAERSRTLIWEETCCWTIGRMVWYLRYGNEMHT